MAGSIAKLVVSLGANVAGFETDMKRATRNQKKRMRDMERQVAQAGKAIGVAFAAAGGSLAVMVKQTTKTADEMQKLSQRTGISTEALSQYRHVADLSGLSMEQFTNGMKRMQRSVSDAEVGLSTQVRAFERLGISVDDLMQMSPDQQFETIADAMVKLESATLRSATAQEIFGRSGTELLSVMANGKAGIEEMRAEADRLGLTIGQDFADNAALFNDNVARMKAGFTGAANQLTAALLPSLLDLQQYFLNSASATDFATSAGQKLGAVLKTLTAAFVIVKNAALGFGKVLLGVFDLLLNAGRAVIAPITGGIQSLIEAFDALKAGDFTAAAAAIGDIGKNIGEDFSAAAERVKTAGGFIVETIGNIDDGLDEVNKIFTTTAKQTDKATDSFKESGKALASTAKGADAAKTAMKRLNYEMKKAVDAGEQSSAMLAETAANLEEVIQEQEAYEQALQSTLDQLYPLEAAGRELGQVLALLTRALTEGKLSWDQYQDAVNRAVAGFDNAVAGLDATANSANNLSTVLDESLRILERTFSDIFDGIVNDSLDAWGAIEAGFKSLVSTIARTPIRAVFEQIQGAFGPGGGGLSDLDLGGEFGQNLVSAIGNIIGLSSADTLFGQLGSTLGSIAGKALGAKFLTALGSFAGPIGSAIGAILGSILGDAIGGLFERDLRFTLGGQNAGTGAQRLRSPLADIIGISGRGGFGDLNDPSTFGGQLGKALVEFDEQLAALLKASAVDDSTFQNVIANLQNWQGTWGEGVEAVDVLQSRFAAVLNAFGSDIQDFVRSTMDFEEQIQRFGVALSLDKFIKENPTVFVDRTVGEILGVVERFKTGAKSIEDAFKEFAAVASLVISVTESLNAFAGSNLRADLDAILNPLTLAESLAAVRDALRTTILEFDGSIDQLQTIGELSMVVRQGELQLLQQIAGIQKGLNSNLDELTADILGIGAEPKTLGEITNEARRLAQLVRTAETASDVSGIGQQFEALIRSIPEDQLNNLSIRNGILSLIEFFQTAANNRLNELGEEAISEGESLRNTVDQFLTEIGDPLEIIANSLDGANINETLNDGFDDIQRNNDANTDRLIAAIVESGNVNVYVTTQDGGLVTQ